MSILRRIRARSRTVRELLRFLWEQKLWWMIPMVLTLVAFGLLLAFAQGSALAPFLYPVF